MTMKEYGRIDTLFARDEHFALTDQLRNPVIGELKHWVVTEKIDGTNIRVCLTAEDEVLVGGRTDRAQIPGDLAAYLYRTFTPEVMKGLRRDDDPIQICLYGEGYGAGIQKGGGLYRKDKGFILFDVRIDDRWWLSDDAVTDIAVQLDIPRAPILGSWTLDHIVSAVREGIPSETAETARMAEGIVARPVMPLYDHRGNRLIIKLKTHDFEIAKR
jgi:hypothetical protein